MNRLQVRLDRDVRAEKAGVGRLRIQHVREVVHLQVEVLAHAVKPWLPEAMTKRIHFGQAAEPSK